MKEGVPTGLARGVPDGWLAGNVSVAFDGGHLEPPSVLPGAGAASERPAATSVRSREPSILQFKRMSKREGGVSGFGTNCGLGRGTLEVDSWYLYFLIAGVRPSLNGLSGTFQANAVCCATHQ